ncbi:hypothetical protein F9L33_09515 [Amylibacter sp. SFDW26]|uniref:hypothetical protein n=1 Tax=Amylibacter sp. SFDW26 TaxID=2652722 RepID=UPI0012619E1E|nr:hypothetical protein [Amylibacter sp. SFDW26]KAB7613608.1 hypothetical protein F9L33_09515 [Amylibacter sp. SFDW26]
MRPNIDFLIPHFNDLGTHALTSVYTDIDDPDLRKAVFENGFLHDKIRTKILNHFDLDVSKISGPAPYETALRYIFESGLERTALGFGCIYNANGLAVAIASGDFKLSEEDVPREILREALKYRSLSKVVENEAPYKVTKLFDDGFQCIHCWCETFDQPFQSLIKIRLPKLPQITDSSDRELRVQICESFLQVGDQS